MSYEEKYEQTKKLIGFYADGEYDVTVWFNGEVIGKLEIADEEFGEQKNIWIFFPKNTSLEPVSYFNDLKETEESLFEDFMSVDVDNNPY